MAEPDATVIAVLDDHQLLRASLAAALEAEGYEVVAPALTEVGEVADILDKMRPAVALLDLDLGPFGSGEELLPTLQELGARVLIVSGQRDAVVGRCLEAGAHGSVSKTASIDELLEAVMKTAAGEPVLSVQERERLLDAWRAQRNAVSEALAPFQSLTKREADVLCGLIAGKSVERIASEFYVSVATVRTQVRAVLMKLGVNSQLEAVAKANRAGWAPGD